MTEHVQVNDQFIVDPEVIDCVWAYSNDYANGMKEYFVTVLIKNQNSINIRFTDEEKQKSFVARFSNAIQAEVADDPA